MTSDLARFEAELMFKLRKDRLVFVSEVMEMGNRHGLSDEQVYRILEQAEKLRVGCFDFVFVCLEPEGRG